MIRWENCLKVHCSNYSFTVFIQQIKSRDCVPVLSSQGALISLCFVEFRAWFLAKYEVDSCKSDLKYTLFIWTFCFQDLHDGTLSHHIVPLKFRNIRAQIRPFYEQDKWSNLLSIVTWSILREKQNHTSELWLQICKKKFSVAKKEEQPITSFKCLI